MKKLFFFSIISIIGSTGYGQKPVTADSTIVPIETQRPRLDFNVGLETSHLWRGLVINDGMTATGNIHYALDKDQNLTVGLWGGAGFDGEYHEINYYIQFQKNNFSIGLWDLFNTTGITNPEVFNYDKNSTTHIIDLRTSYRFPEAFPIQVEADVLLYGNDRELENINDFKNRYSTYLELNYPLIRNQKADLDIFVGAGFAIDGKSHLYTKETISDLDIVNTGLKVSKNLTVFNYKLPVSATAMWNPTNKIARIKLDINLF